MMLRFMKALLSIMISFLGACDSSNSFIEKELSNENQVTEMNQTKNENHDIHIFGGFAATLRAVLADYMVDDSTLKVLVLQQFQGKMSLVYVDENITYGLEIGKTYYFEIESYIIEDTSYTAKQVLQMIGDNYGAFDWLKITDYRDPKENEIGLESFFIQAEEIISN